MLLLKGEIVEKNINHMHSWGDKLIFFKQAPAEVCKQCGEIYFKPEVVKAFDRVTTHLEVVPFPELTTI